jgi:hypothetical protein
MRRVHLLVWMILCTSCGGTVMVDEGQGASGAGQDPGATGGASSGGVEGGEVAPPGTCPPTPDCNWCKGDPRVDGRGCVVGYTCANGADACSTKPCAAPEECGGKKVCLPDGLCWEGPTFCKPKSCEGSSGDECACSRSCDDGRVYRSECSFDGTVMCKCRIDGVAFPWVCIVEEGGTDACGLGAACCGFPE